MTNDDIITIVRERFGLTRAQIMAKRPKGGCMARFTAMWLCRSVLGMKYTEIAASFGVNHATVINAVNRVEAYIETEPNRKHTIEELQAQVIKKIGSIPA
jgi:chromosomal replication initiation ATPase DnaA